MSTPIVDALEKSIESRNRDVPERVYETARRLERDRAELIEALRDAIGLLSALFGDYRWAGTPEREHLLALQALLSRLEKP